ncbi:MAG: CotH kinase family protein [Lutisporaceae bacterium]
MKVIIMKQSWKLRYIFLIMCTVIILYLGFKTDKLSLNAGQEEKEYDLVINEVMNDNRNSIRDEDGDFEDWIEIYNKGDTAINLNGFGLSDDSKQPFLWTFPDITIEPKAFLIVWTSGENKNESGAPMHTNFKLKSKDSVLILTSPNKSWSNIFALEPMGENISYGRVPDGSLELYGFDEGTPGKANISERLIEGVQTKRLNSPVFSNNGGFYTQDFALIINTNDANAEIYYTLDGSVPTKESDRYTNKSLLISSKTNEATVVRARAYKEGYPKSEVVTKSYFVEKDIYNSYNIPVISLVTEPSNLFDYEEGIYVAGKVFDEWKANLPIIKKQQFKPGNYSERGREWEREASIELYEPNGKMGLIQNIAIRISGGSSRANTIKSFSLWANSDYDDKDYFIYDFFDGKAKNLVSGDEINEFSQLLLRTSATDSESSFFRDAFMQSLIKDPMILDTQSTKPCILYLNGEYYGIRNIREAYDKSYISSHYSIDEEDVVIIKNPTGYTGVEIQAGYAGDEMHYNEMIAYVKKHDMKIDSNYNFLKTLIDIDNYIEYNVVQIYCDNSDWPGNNVRVWRKRTQSYKPNAPYGSDGRWRWMVFDLDHGFGLFDGEKAASSNSLVRATDTDGRSWPNPPWSTLLLRTLLENSEFKNQFINTFADRLNTAFLPETVIEKVEAMEQIYYSDVENHIVRWNLHDNKIESWLEEVEVMKNFAVERPKYMRQYIAEYFDLSGTAAIRVEVSGGGIVKVNSLNITHTPTTWEGVYFKDIPITIEAVAEPGYVFAGWEGSNKTQEKTITIKPSQSIQLKAIFKIVKSN